MDKKTRTYFIEGSKIIKPVVIKHSHKSDKGPSKLTLYKASLKSGITGKQKRIFVPPCIGYRASSKKVNQIVAAYLNSHYKVVIEQ